MILERLEIHKPIFESISNKKVLNRNQEEHHFLIRYYGGVREYLLSMGEFKDAKIDS